MCLLLVAGLGVPTACGDGDDGGQPASRGAPKTAGGGKSKKEKKTSRRPAQGADAAPAEDVPEHPKVVLTREDFGLESRDPFQPFLGNEVIETSDSPRDVLRQRDVRLAEYNFEDLTLIGIVMSGRGIQPRALFLASDNKSKSVKQGEYFSRAEVLLAAVNRDYIEIEVVDEELAKGLNMATGERRPIYLKKD
jgi:Tfp pilus assembly protein PilP